MIAVLMTLCFLFVIAVAGVITLLGVGPEQSWPENFWRATTHVLDPGVVSGDAGWPWRATMMTVTLVGILVLSSLISILSAGLSVKIDELRKGRSLVVERDHIVVLGWSPKIFTILAELIQSQASRRDSCVVILAERDKVEMEDELRLKLPRNHHTRIVCRAGNPTDPHDLELVSPQLSRAIVVLAPQSGNPDAETVKTVLALTNRPRPKNAKPYHIVAEIRQSENLRLARLVGKSEVELVAADDLVARMTVQATRQLGLSLVYTELMDFGGHEIYFDGDARVGERSYSDLLLSYAHCAVMGVQFRDGRVTLNPPMSTRLQKGDKAVVLAEDDSRISMGKGLVKATHPYVSEHFALERQPEKVLLLGWNDKAPIIMQELDRYMAPGSGLTVVSSYDVSNQFDEQLPFLNNLKADYWTSPTSDRQVLEGLDVSDYQHVMVLAYRNHLDQQECDAQTLMTLLNLRDLCNDCGSQVGLLSEMLDVRNRELAEVTRADDFIVSDRLVSLLMTQVTENKDVMRVFDDLFHIEGSECFLRPAEHYVQLGRPVNFYAVVESGIFKGQTPIGYRVKADHYNSERHYGMHLNPLKSEPITFAPGDQVVVLAQTDVGEGASAG